MKKFQDNTGREFVIKVTVKTVKDVRDRLGFDLTKIFEPNSPLADLADDPFKTCELIHICCQSADDKPKPDFDAFISAIGGEQVEDAMSALIEGVIAFFPNKRRREALTSLASKIETTANDRVEKAATMIESLTQEDVSRLLTKSQESSEASIQTPSP